MGDGAPGGRILGRGSARLGAPPRAARRGGSRRPGPRPPSHAHQPEPPLPLLVLLLLDDPLLLAVIAAPEGLTAYHFLPLRTRPSPVVWPAFVSPTKV